MLRAHTRWARAMFLALLALTLAVSTGCGKRAPPPPAAAPVHIPEPDWLVAAPAEIRDVYLWAAANQAVLRYIPCYCGCNAQGHRDNYECYVKDTADGPQYEQHAYG